MKMSTLGLRWPGSRCSPPAVVPPVWLALVISKLVNPAVCNFSVTCAGHAWFDLKPNPADKLSPSTRIRFIGEGSCLAAAADCADQAAKTAAIVPHCFIELPILLFRPP